MKNEDNIIGYEIINEPYSTDLYEDPTSIIDPQKDDVKYLEPLYANVHDKIREKDNNTIIFFEPIVNDIYKVGLQKGPGGPEWNDKQALSYHVYCEVVDADGDPKNKLLCHGIDNEFFSTKLSDAKKIGVASFMTEFGSVAETKDALDEIDYIMNLADSKF